MDLAPIHDKRVLGVNNAYMLGDWVDAVFFGDCRWWDWNKETLNKFGGLRITCCQRSKPFPGVLHLRRGKSTGIESRPGFISWNRNSGASAINVAYHLGAVRVVLIGFDMKMTGNNHNWHHYHKHTPPANIYQNRFLPVFAQIARDARELGLQIINATPDSEIKEFPMMKLEHCI
jgi:hypothetical protein